MPDYSKLHQWVSHRVRIDYDTGAHIVGYLASCQPADGDVQFAKLKHAELRTAAGDLIDELEEITICPNAITSMAMDEGPRGRDIG